MQRERTAGAVMVFEALHHICVAIGGVLEPFELARLVAERARGLLSADAVDLWLFDEQSGSLGALHLEHPPAPLRPGEGPVGRAFSKREPVTVSEHVDWDQTPARNNAVQQAGIAVPLLLVGGRAIGVLGIGFREPDKATPAAVSTVTLLAAQVAPAFEAARRYETACAELAERRRAEEALRFEAHLLEAVEHGVVALDLD